MAYQPGPWFNSAKFFDIEYQTYGRVGSQLNQNESGFYWEHPGGKMCLHVVWDKQSSEFIGINAFGLRLRHELFNDWLQKRATIREVLANLRTANFDPELYRHYEEEIIAEFNEETGMSVTLKPKKWWRQILQNG